LEPTGRWGMQYQTRTTTREDGFDTAQGYVRDGLASLRNLENLLKSPKIGPRALEKAVAQIHAGCSPFRDALVSIVDMVGSRKAELPVGSLSDFARDRVDQLCHAVSNAAKKDMGAKSRLRLERQITEVLPDLDVVRELIDLLDSATYSAPTELDLNALLWETLTHRVSPHPNQPEVVPVALSRAAEGATVWTDARVLMPMMSIAFGSVAHQGAKQMHVSAELDEQGGASVLCRRDDDHPAANLPCVWPRVVMPSRDVLSVASALTGVTLSMEPTTVTLRILPQRSADDLGMAVSNRFLS